MSDLEKVIRFKEMNNIPYSKDEIEYWGPVDEDFSDVFYKIGNSFISDHYSLVNGERMDELKNIFALLLKNVVSFSKKSSDSPFPYVYFNLNHKENVIVGNVAIQLESNCDTLIKKEMEDELSISKAELQQLDDTDISELHLLMKLAKDTFQGEIIEKGNDHWLVLKLILE